MEELEQIIDKVSKDSGKSRKEVQELVDAKKEELSGLVSEEGAAMIVGRELGVSLLTEGRKKMKVKNLVEGLQSVDFVGRITGVSEVREFEREGKKGRVQNLILGDETGTIRMSLWNNDTDIITALELKEDDVVAVSGGFVKTDNRGNLELRIGRGKLEKSKAKVKVVEGAGKGLMDAKRKTVKELQEGDIAEVRGCLVQLYRKNLFYEVCPDCGTRVVDDDGKTACKDHGIVKPDLQVVVSGVLDDGTGNIRAVFFRELAEQLFGEKTAGLKQIADRGKGFDAVFDQFKGMGKDFVVRGRVKKNSFTDSLELMANGIQDVDVRTEAETLLKELEGG